MSEVLHTTSAAGHRRHLSRCIACVALLLTPVAAACGKKGPPLAPLRLVPEAPTEVTLRRAGDKAFLRFTLPKKNANGPGAVSLDRVEIYAVTAAAGEALPADRELLSKAHVVGTISVKPPAPEDQPEDQKTAADKRPSAGDVVTFAEDLTASALAPTPFEQPRETKTTRTQPTGGAGAPARAPYAVRVYIARGLTRGGRPGPPTARQQLPIVPLPPAPSDALGMFNEKGVRLVWLPPAAGFGALSGIAATLAASAQPAAAVLGLESPEPTQAAGAAAGPPTEAPAAGTVPPVPPLPGTSGATGTAPAAAQTAATTQATGAAPAGPPSTAGAGSTAAPASGAAKPPQPAGPGEVAQPVTFNVYAVGNPAPLNPSPIAVLSFDHEGAAFGKEQCFEVRAIETVANVAIEGDQPAGVCLTPRDVFPPAPPKGLAAVAGPGAINLIWDANTEPDLAGYLVLRGEGAGDTLQPLMPAPIHDTHYTDTTVTEGVHYVYVVIAVDNATPPNQSARTARVEETAR